MSTYYSILTAIGQASVANAVALGQLVDLTHMAVGDGGGEAISPQADMTALVGETYRAQINTLSIDESDAGHVIAELVIPTSEGGWTVREVGIFDTDGNLFAIGSLPASAKPALGEGAGAELTIRMHLTMATAEAGTLELIIDPTVVLASRVYVDDEIIEHDENPDAHADLMPVNATTALRGIVELATNTETTTGTDTERAVTPAGLANALDGLAAAQATTEASGIVELATNAETITGTDSERAVTPAADAAALAEHNGSNTAHEDIRALVAASVPTGVVITWPTASLPDGYLECNGAALSRTTYADLFTALGILYGNGDGSTTFNLPDYRGEFHRGLDHGRGADPDAATRTDRGDGTTGDAVGSKQMDEFDEHRHSCTTVYSGNNGTSTASATVAFPNTNGYTNYTGGSETRPRNVNVIYCIKY